MRHRSETSIVSAPYLDIFLAALGGGLVGLAFPKFVGLWPLAWVGLAPLLLALRHATPRRGLLLGAVAGIFEFSLVIYWIAYVTTTYGGMSLPAGVGVAALLVLYLAMYSALFGLGLAYASRCGLPQWVVAPPLWVGLEYLRGILLTGFPWAELGASQYTWNGFVQAADLGGVALLSFVVVLVNAALVAAWAEEKTSRGVVAGLAALAALSLTLTYGHFRLGHIEAAAAAAPKLAVVAVQGNIDQGVKWSDGFQGKSVEIYRKLTEKAAASHPDLIVWPETALPFYFLLEDRFTPKVMEGLKGLPSYVLLGSPAYDFDADDICYYNRAYLLAPGGQPTAKYDKVHLVPYGEYVPLKSYMPFLGKAVRAVGNFQAGRPGCCLSLGGPRPARVGVLICFESIFADLAREAVGGGATILAVITNDAWFGGTSAPYQHFSMSVLRAVETRRAVVRAANTGISGLIGPDGRVLAATRLQERTYVRGVVPLMTIKTVYTKIGDAFAWLCLAVSGGLGVFWGAVREGKKS
ncbi:MAG: apolipoprotein N-acyltransferase [Pseudomonadota bacterium]